MKSIAPLLLVALAACEKSHTTPAAATPPPKDSAPAPAGDTALSLFDGKTLGKWKATEFGGQGEVRVEKGAIVVDAGAALSGVHWTGDVPKVNYELTLEAMKVDGSDFFCGIAFPYKDSFCSFVAGGWGGGTVGLSSVDGMNASENETSGFVEFSKDRWYAFRLRVTSDKIEVWIDGKQLVNLETKDRKITIHPAMELSCPLGLTNFTTASAYRNIKLRTL